MIYRRLINLNQEVYTYFYSHANLPNLFSYQNLPDGPFIQNKTDKPAASVNASGITMFQKNYSIACCKLRTIVKDLMTALIVIDGSGIIN